MDRNMKQPPWRAIQVATWTIALLATLLLFVLPLAVSLWLRTKPDLPPDMLMYLRWLEICQKISMQILAGGYFFVVGSCFASFLNVVAWRVPRGQSIIGHSRCPYCHNRLRLRDNFPIIGWLRNQGQCRFCEAPISPRYLIVEAFLGTVFLMIGLATLATGGITLPIRPPNLGMGFERYLFHPKWDLLQIIMGQLALLLFLFTFMLIELERFRIPQSILVTGVFCGFAMAFCAPSMFLVEYGWPFQEQWPMASASFPLLATLMIGAGAGAVLGKILNRRLRARLDERLDAETHSPLPLSSSAATEPGQESVWKDVPAEIRETFETLEIPEAERKYLASVADQQESESEIHGPGKRLAPPPEIENPQSVAAENVHVKGEQSQARSYKVTSSFYYGLVLCGLFLGWQSAVIISIWAALLCCASPNQLRQSKIPLVTGSSLVFIACLFHLMTWRWFNLLAN